MPPLAADQPRLCMVFVVVSLLASFALEAGVSARLARARVQGLAAACRRQPPHGCNNLLTPIIQQRSLHVRARHAQSIVAGVLHAWLALAVVLHAQLWRFRPRRGDAASAHKGEWRASTAPLRRLRA